MPGRVSARDLNREFLEFIFRHKFQQSSVSHELQALIDEVARETSADHFLAPGLVAQASSVNRIFGNFKPRVCNYPLLEQRLIRVINQSLMTPREFAEQLQAIHLDYNMIINAEYSLAANERSLLVDCAKGQHTLTWGDKREMLLILNNLVTRLNDIEGAGMYLLEPCATNELASRINQAVARIKELNSNDNFEFLLPYSNGAHWCLCTVKVTNQKIIAIETSDSKRGPSKTPVFNRKKAGSAASIYSNFFEQIDPTYVQKQTRKALAGLKRSILKLSAEKQDKLNKLDSVDEAAKTVIESEFESKIDEYKAKQLVIEQGIREHDKACYQRINRQQSEFAANFASEFEFNTVYRNEQNDNWSCMDQTIQHVLRKMGRALYNPTTGRDYYDLSYQSGYGRCNITLRRSTLEVLKDHLIGQEIATRDLNEAELERIPLHFDRKSLARLAEITKADKTRSSVNTDTDITADITPAADNTWLAKTIKGVLYGILFVILLPINLLKWSFLLGYKGASGLIDFVFDSRGTNNKVPTCTTIHSVTSSEYVPSTNRSQHMVDAKPLGQGPAQVANSEPSSNYRISRPR